MDSNTKLKAAYVIVERGDKSYWTKIGVAFTNRDGSLNVRLDAVPVGGTLHIRDWEPREEGVADPTAARGRRNAAPARAAQAEAL